MKKEKEKKRHERRDKAGQTEEGVRLNGALQAMPLSIVRLKRCQGRVVFAA